MRLENYNENIFNILFFLSDVVAEVSLNSGHFVLANSGHGPGVLGRRINGTKTDGFSSRRDFGEKKSFWAVSRIRCTRLRQPDRAHAIPGGTHSSIKQSRSLCHLLCDVDIRALQAILKREYSGNTDKCKIRHANDVGPRHKAKTRGEKNERALPLFSFWSLSNKVAANCGPQGWTWVG